MRPGGQRSQGGDEKSAYLGDRARIEMITDEVELREGVLDRVGISRGGQVVDAVAHGGLPRGPGRAILGRATARRHVLHQPASTAGQMQAVGEAHIARQGLGADPARHRDTGKPEVRPSRGDGLAEVEPAVDHAPGQRAAVADDGAGPDPGHDRPQVVGRALGRRQPGPQHVDARGQPHGTAGLLLSGQRRIVPGVAEDERAGRRISRNRPTNSAHHADLLPTIDEILASRSKYFA